MDPRWSRRGDTAGRQNLGRSYLQHFNDFQGRKEEAATSACGPRQPRAHPAARRAAFRGAAAARLPRLIHLNFGLGTIAAQRIEPQRPDAGIPPEARHIHLFRRLGLVIAERVEFVGAVEEALDRSLAMTA